MDDSSNNSIFRNAIKKFQEKPFFYTGVVALSGVVIPGLYGLKKRNMRLSLYLINLRLAAQGTFVTIMTGGVIYALSRHYFKDEDNIERTGPTKR